jgi:hypothetical protein
MKVLRALRLITSATHCESPAFPRVCTGISQTHFARQRPTLVVFSPGRQLQHPTHFIHPHIFSTWRRAYATESSPSRDAETPRPPRWRSVAFKAIFLLYGFGQGFYFLGTYVRPPLSPEPGKSGEQFIASQLRNLVEHIPKIKQLSKDPAWESWDAYSNLDEEGRKHHLTSGAMSGTRGLAVQRVFWNKETGQAVSVIYFGQDLSSWPGVIHGGAIATIVDESLGRVAIRTFPSHTGMYRLLPSKLTTVHRPGLLMQNIQLTCFGPTSQA